MDPDVHHRAAPAKAGVLSPCLLVRRIDEAEACPAEDRPADRALIDKLLDLLLPSVELKRIIARERDTVLAACINDALPLVHVHGEGLFAHDVLSGPSSGRGLTHVTVDGRADIDGLHRRILQ